MAPPHIKAADYIVKQVFEQQASPYYKTEKKNITLSFGGGWPAGAQCLMWWRAVARMHACLLCMRNSTIHYCMHTHEQWR